MPPQRSGDQLIYRRAENGELVGYTPAEYGVRKDDGGGMVKPVNSSGGLLFLAVFVSLLAGGVVYGITRIAIDGTWEILGEVWWVVPAGIFVPVAAWYGYLKERRAEKLRKVRNLPRPVD
ncbi:hypothetical protein [Arthrobacter celericrescens]|uniref:hypothetical protein n=1 Tax=Arthrobacter celericrescens TaxID=2320851 RepID=UPI000EA31230|nr:hypothetical protein [Arthrobacter celericrescens]